MSRSCAGLLLVTVCLVSVSCTQTASKGAFVDPAFGPLVPPSTGALIGVRIDKIKESALYKQYQGQFDLSALNEFSQRTGLDPRRDVWSVLIALNGHDSLAMARGRFTVGELEPKLEGLGARRVSYKNYTLIGTDGNSAVFLNPGVAVAGPSAALHELIDRRSQNNGGIPEELQQRLESLPGDDQLYLVSRIGLPQSLFPKSAEVQSALENIVAFVSGVTVGVRADSGLHLTADIACVSEAGAKRVDDALRGGIGLARLSTRDNDDQMLRVYDAIHVNLDKLTVHVNADLSADAVGKLANFLPKLPGAAAGAVHRLEH